MPESRHAKCPGIILLAAVLILALLPLAAFADTSPNIYSPYVPETSRLPDRSPVEDTSVARDPQMTDTYSFSFPWLTDLELAKMREFQAALRDGEVGYEGKSIINPFTVTSRDVAVFTLDPGDFAGESFYVFLPDNTSLTDTQLVALAAAFEELGINFDPDSLNDRNCCRNRNVLETRTLTAEENSRMEAIKDKIRRGQLKKESAQAGTQILAVGKITGNGTDADRKTFLFYPYRQLTDDELILFALEDEEEWTIHPEELKTAALKGAGSLVNLPQNIREYQPCISREHIWGPESPYLSRNNPFYKYLGQFYGEGYDGFYDRIHCSIDIVQMQETGSAPELAGIHLWYGYYPTFSDSNYPESREAEWLAAAQDWAEKTLLLPADVLRDGWTVTDSTVSNTDSPLVHLRLVTEELEICIMLYRNSTKISDCLIYSRKWYDDSDKGFRL